MPSKSLPKAGDKVFVINDETFEIKETVVADAPSECLWVKGARSNVMVGPHRWARTKAEAKDKAVKLAANKRAELTDKLAGLDSIISKLGSK